MFNLTRNVHQFIVSYFHVRYCPLIFDAATRKRTKALESAKWTQVKDVGLADNRKYCFWLNYHTEQGDGHYERVNAYCT
jgi:hypothetical protein